MADNPEEQSKQGWTKRRPGEPVDRDPRKLPPELQEGFAKAAGQFLGDRYLAGDAFKQVSEANIERAREIGVAARVQRKADTEEAFVNALRTVNAESAKSTLPESVSDEIHAILSEPDLWSFSQPEIRQPYTRRLARHAWGELCKRDNKEMIAAATLPSLAAIAIGIYAGWGWQNLLTAVAAGVGAGIITLIATLAVIFFLHLVSAPREIDEASQGDFAALKSQLLEEKRKLRRVVDLLANERGSEIAPNLVIDYRPDEATPHVMRGEGVTQHRISIISPAQINDVELVANHFKATHLPLLFDIPLRPMNDRDRVKGTKRVILKAGKKMYWDVVSVVDGGPNGRCSVYLSCLPSSGIIELNDPGKYEFELMATGGELLPITKIVSFEVTKDYHIVDFQLKDGRLSA